MISQVQFGNQSMTASKQAMPESIKFDGQAGISTSSGENKFAANSNTHLAKPGFSD
jgi:hypothetical protein